MVAAIAPGKKPPPINRAKHAQERFRQALIKGDGLPDYPKELAEALDECTDKQRHFALLLAGGTTPMQAYRQVYNVSPTRDLRSVSADVNEAMAHPRVSRAHSLAAQWLDTNWLLDAAQTASWAVSNLYDLAEHGKHEATRLKATELLLRKHGELVDRKVVTHIDGTEADTQEALLKSILSDIEALPVLESPLPALPARPNGRPESCPRCGGVMVDSGVSGDGDGI